MYGLLLRNFHEYIVKTYGDKKWKEIKDNLKLTQVHTCQNNQKSVVY
jgi:hypothetical protein